MVAAPLKSSQRFELFGRIRRRTHLRMRLRDLPLFVDDVRDAPRVLVFRRVGRAVRQSDRAVDVAEQREVEAELLGEVPVLFLRVETDAEDGGVLRGVLAGEVPEPGTFPRSTGGVGFRIEPEHDFPAAQIGEADAVAVVIEDVEIGSSIAGLEHGFRFPPREHAQNTAQRHQ
jgi:hypothetical protein